MTNSQIPVSVIMSVYNEKEEWLKLSIDSILSQTFADFEFIIINDNPNLPLNQKILNEYKLLDDRIIIVNNEQNIGLTKSLNKALGLAKGVYIARMDADDISEPNRFEEQYNFMERNKEYIVCGSCMTIFPSSSKENVRIFPESNDDLQALLFFENCIPHPTAFIRHSVLTNNGITYNEQLRFSQDYELWCQLAPLGMLVNIQMPLLKYRRSANQISTKSLGSQSEIANSIRRNYLKIVLANSNINVNDTDINFIVKSIRTLNIQTQKKRFMLASYYEGLPKYKCIIAPIFNRTVLKLGKLYFSTVKRKLFS